VKLVEVKFYCFIVVGSRVLWSLRNGTKSGENALSDRQKIERRKRDIEALIDKSFASFEGWEKTTTEIKFSRSWGETKRDLWSYFVNHM
jgi:hypothetical protein